MTYELVIAALADNTRRQILEQLRNGPATVVEIAATQPVSRPAVSQHLRILSDSKLVTATPQGNRRLYSVNATGLNELKNYLDTYWSDALDAYSGYMNANLEKNSA